MELNKEEAIDKDVAAEAEGAFTPIQTEKFVLYNNRNVQSTKCSEVIEKDFFSVFLVKYLICCNLNIFTNSMMIF